MKILVLLLLLTSSVYANTNQTCQSVMEDKWGYELDRFIGVASNYKQACINASNKCKIETARRGGQLFCRIDSNTNPPYPPINFSCSTYLKSIDGRYLRTYQGYSSTQVRACLISNQYCLNEISRMKRNRSYRGENCQTNNRGGFPDPGRDIITRSCLVNLVDPQYGTIGRYNATASGQRQRSQNIYERACSKAIQSCMIYKLPYQLCLKAL